MEWRRPYPEIVVLVASAAWGLFWIPLRAFEHHGLGPAWATLAQLLTPLAIMTPFAAARQQSGPQRPSRRSSSRASLGRSASPRTGDHAAASAQPYAAGGGRLIGARPLDAACLSSKSALRATA